MSIVYVLTNPVMPGLVKIGRTMQEDAAIRIAQLYTTGVPVPFEIAFAAKVENPEEVEKALHIAFTPNRVNPKREFFRIDPEQAIVILKLLHVEDATKVISQQPTGLDPESVAAGAQQSSRRPNLNFVEMGIPIGATLQSVHGDVTVSVVDARRVRLGEEDLYLTAATRQVLGTEYNVAPAPHWTYLGRPLTELYEETYGQSV